MLTVLVGFYFAKLCFLNVEVLSMLRHMYYYRKLCN